MLPQVVTNVLITIMSGALGMSCTPFTLATTKISLVMQVGYYLPFAVGSGVFTAVGSGLISTLTPTLSVARWIGYLIIQGGQGMGFQMPILAVRNFVEKDVSAATSLVVFAQNLSGAVFLSLGGVIFNNQLRHGLATYAPDADVTAVIAPGAAASDVRNAVAANLLPGVILAYSKSYDHVMYLGIGAACGAFVSAFGMGWVRLKKESAEGGRLNISPCRQIAQDENIFTFTINVVTSSTKYSSIVIIIRLVNLNRTIINEDMKIWASICDRLYTL
jgi:hypothetical protein